MGEDELALLHQVMSSVQESHVAPTHHPCSLQTRPGAAVTAGEGTQPSTALSTARGTDTGD